MIRAFQSCVFAGICASLIANTLTAQPVAPDGRKAASQPRTAGSGWTETESAAHRTSARKALSDGKLEDAAKWVRQARGVRFSSEVDEWRLVEAELEMARGAFAKAGLAAMRVVILSPKSASVGEALFLAGRACEGLGRPLKAVELYRECAAAPRTAAKIQESARERLAALEKKASNP